MTSRWRWVERMANSSLPPNAKLVAHTIATFANGDGHCWPSYATIARRSGLCRRTVVTNVQALTDAGWLLTAARVDHQGQHSNSYQLIVPATGTGTGTNGPVDNPPPSAPDAPGVVHQLHPPVHDMHPPGSASHAPRTPPQRTPTHEPPTHPVDNQPPSRHLAAVVGDLARSVKLP